jgi:hypothetical protein
MSKAADSERGRIGNKIDLARLLGTWRLVRGTARDANGNSRPSPFGPKGMGLLTLTGEGRMMAVLCDGRKDVPDDEIRNYASYCGNYTFDGTTLVTRVDASFSPRAVVGSDQIRMIRFEGELLVLVPPPVPTADGAEYREMFWEHIGCAAG